MCSSRSARSSSFLTISISPAQSDQKVSLRRSSHGKVEQDREHLRRQLDRDGVDPVELAVPRQRSSISPVRRRMSVAHPRHFGRGEGGRDGAALRRCGSGRSRAMNIGIADRRSPDRNRRCVMPPAPRNRVRAAIRPRRSACRSRPTNRGRNRDSRYVVDRRLGAQRARTARARCRRGRARRGSCRTDRPRASTSSFARSPCASLLCRPREA